MTARTAEDNVTMNEQMIEILSLGWKGLAKAVGEDWDTVKKALLTEIASLEKQDDPDSDRMVSVIAKHLKPYPDALKHVNQICDDVMGHRMDEFEVPEFDPVPEPEPELEPIGWDDDEDFVDDTAAASGSKGYVESGEAEAVAMEPEMVAMEPELTLAEDEGFYRVPVYFATNRKRDKRFKLEKSHLAFTGKPSDEMHYGLAQVSMPKTHVAGKLEGPGRIFNRKADPKKHILVLSVDLKDKTTFISDMNNSLANAEANEALVYIHGYNVSFGGALRITAQVATDLDFKGIPITYSWPSRARTLHYLTDEKSIAKGQKYFDEFLETIIKELNVSKIHILAHSMGNRLATLGMQNVSMDLAKGKLGQVIFASPDVSRSNFTERAKKFAGKADRYTLYINDGDLALELSQVIHFGPRAGEKDDFPLVVDTVDTVDATPIEMSLLGHSFYQKDTTVIDDIVSMITQNLAPPRVSLTEISGSKRYWEFIKK